MKRRKNMIFITLIVVAYMAFIQSFDLTYERKNIFHKIEYNGLLWVALDYYTIVKYNSSDKPMKWYRHLRTDIKIKPKGCTSLIFPNNCHNAGCLYCNRYNDFKASL